MATVKNRRILLARRPTGEPSEADFALSQVELEDPQPGQMLLRTLWLSLDPYMRGRMSDRKSYAPSVGIGDVMVGGTVTAMDSIPRWEPTVPELIKDRTRAPEISGCVFWSGAVLRTETFCMDDCG
jgi:hypothetical protein